MPKSRQTCSSSLQCQKADELGNKLTARLMLSDKSPKIYLPSKEEWIGLNLLERDDELPSLKDASNVIHHPLNHHS